MKTAGTSPPLLALAAAALACPLAATRAEVVNDPFPERISKGDVRVELKTVAAGLASPVLLVAAPDASERLYIVDQAGTVRIVDGGSLLPDPCLDVTGRIIPLNKDFD